MKNVKLFIAAGIILFALGAKAQKMTEGDRDLSFLRGQTKFNIEYDYSNMTVGKKTEADYKAEKIEAFNKKEPGKGHLWEQKWIENRANVYEPMFERLINVQLNKCGASAAYGLKDAKYTILVHTVLTEPGFNTVVMVVNPHCDFFVSYIETATGKVVAKGYLNNVQGINMADSGWDFDPAPKIKECYAKLGKVVGISMMKEINAGGNNKNQKYEPEPEQQKEQPKEQAPEPKKKRG